MTYRDQLLKLYPDAKCMIKNPDNSELTRWNIIADQKIISFSYGSEEKAWKGAVEITNYRILEKFKQS